MEKYYGNHENVGHHELKIINQDLYVPWLRIVYGELFWENNE